MIQEYTFTTSSDFVFGNSIEILSGQAQLKEDSNTNIFVENFGGGSDFTYNSDLVAFNDEEFPDATVGISYSSSINADWGDCNLTGTATGSAAISNGVLRLDYADARYVTYTNVEDLDLEGKGCIKFRLTSNYTGTPVATVCFISSGTHGGNLNAIEIAHLITTGDLEATIYDSTGTLISTTTYAAFSPTSGESYTIEYNFDSVNGYYSLWMDGVFLSDATGTGLRTTPAMIRVGSNTEGAMVSNYKISNVIFYKKPQHIADIYDPYFYSQVRQSRTLLGVHQISSVNSDCSCSATYTSSINLSTARGDTAGTATGGATITGNRLDLTGGGIKYVSYDGVLNADAAQVGAVKFKVRSDYSGSPASAYHFFIACKAGGDADNTLTLYHDSDGDIKILVIDDAGADIISDAVFGSWTPVSGTTYEFELNYDFTEGETILFIDGVQLGATNTTTGERSSEIELLRVGSNYDGSTSNDSYFEDFIVFDSLQDTEDYTPGYALYESKYPETIITLPTKTYAGGAKISKFNKFLIESEVNAPRYIVNGNYWNGSAWAASSDTYATASTALDIHNNISSLTASDSAIVDVVFQSTDDFHPKGLSDKLIIEYNASLYFLGYPDIYPVEFIQTDELNSFTFTQTISGSDTITYVLVVDGVDKYWTGAAWATSSGYTQSNTAAVINTNCSSYVFVTSASVGIKAYLHSNDGSTTPKIDKIVIDYEFKATLPTTPSTCVVYGYFYDGEGSPQLGVTVFAKITVSEAWFNNETIVTKKEISVTSGADGYWELPLIPSALMTGQVGYRFKLLGKGVYVVINKIVPNETDINFINLVNL
jgi:hypothetical protein